MRTWEGGSQRVAGVYKGVDENVYRSLCPCVLRDAHECFGTQHRKKEIRQVASTICHGKCKNDILRCPGASHQSENKRSDEDCRVVKKVEHRHQLRKELPRKHIGKRFVDVKSKHAVIQRNNQGVVACRFMKSRIDVPHLKPIKDDQDHGVYGANNRKNSPPVCFNSAESDRKSS